MPDNLLSPLQVAPFEDWDYEDVRKILQQITPELHTRRENYAVHNDHFQRGKEWVGPGDATVKSSPIEEQFAPEDAIGEVLSNVSNAFSEPQVGGAPLEELAGDTRVPAETQARIAEAVGLLSGWWDKQKIQEHIQERQATGAWAGWADLRLWIPWRFLMVDSDGDITVRPTSDIKEALSFIHLSAPGPLDGFVWTDPGTQDKVAIYFDKEIQYEGPEKTRTEYNRAELVYLDPMRERDEDAKTIVKVVYSDKNKKQPVRTELDLGGRLLCSEMEVRSLLTDPVLRTQRQLNFICTLVTRLSETAAFRERYTLNAVPHGERVAYNEGDTLPSGAYLERDDEGRLWAILPTVRTLGANTTTELVGLPTYDDTGRKGNGQVGVEVIDPVDPKPYLEAADAVRRRILRMCHQGHLGGVSNAESSGIAYEQARAVFEKDLNARRIAEEGMMRDILTAALALAETIAGKKGYFTDRIRITVDQHINPGPRSPDLVRLDLESYEAGALSRETTMSRIGVEDVDAEMVRVRRSSAHILEVLEKAAATTETFTTESIIEVLKELNVPKEIIEKLEVAEPPEPPTPAVPDTEDADAEE